MNTEETLETTPVSLDQTRAWLTLTAEYAVDEGGTWAMTHDAGSGKSYAFIGEAVLRSIERREKLTIAIPTHDLAAETMAKVWAFAEGQTLDPDWTVDTAPTRTRHSCPRFDEVCAAAAIHPKGSTIFCQGCEVNPSRNAGRAGCGFFDRMKVGDPDVLIMTHAMVAAGGGEGRGGMLIIDEDPSGAASAGVDVTSHALLDARTSGQIKVNDAAAWDRLLVAVGKGERLRPEELLEICPTDAIEVLDPTGDAGGARVILEALECGTGTGRLDRLQEGVPWRALAALSQALESEWGAAEVAPIGRRVPGGSLRLFHVGDLKLDAVGARVSIYLDATATEAHCEAVMGEEVEIVGWDIILPDEVTWHHIDYDTGPSSRVMGMDGRPGGKRAPAVWEGAMRRFGAGEGALIVTQKRYRDGDSWTSGVLDELAEGGSTVIHHNGTESRGSNSYEGCHSIIIDSWHVPRSAIRQQAYAYCIMSGDDWTDPWSRECWIAEARWKLEGAVLRQEVMRIRPYAADPNSPKRIIVMGKIVPGQIMDRPIQTETIDLLDVAESMGYESRDRTPMQPEALGGVSFARGTRSRNDTANGEEIAVQSKCQKCPKEREDDPDTYSARSLRTAFEDRVERWHRGDPGVNTPERWAELTGSELVWVSHDRPGRAFAMHHFGDINDEGTQRAIEEELVRRGVMNYRLGDEPWQVRAGCHPVMDRCLMQMPNPGTWGVEDAIMSLMLLGGVSRRTVLAWILGARLKGEDSADCLARLWLGLQILDRTEVIEAAWGRGPDAAATWDRDRGIDIYAHTLGDYASALRENDRLARQQVEAQSSGCN